MNLFRVNDQAKSYAPALLRIFVCLAIILLLSFRNKLIKDLPNPLWIQLLLGAFGFFCVLGILSGIAEMIYVKEGKENEALDKQKPPAEKKLVEKRTIVELIEKNDIIEVRIATENAIIRIGASSVSDRRSGKFYDKIYYVGKLKFGSIEEFQAHLDGYTNDGNLAVISIE